MDTNIDDLTANAARCYRLAAMCTDRTIAQRLLEVAREYCTQALALGADPETLPQPQGRHNPDAKPPTPPKRNK